MKKFLASILLLFITLPALAENTILIIGNSLTAGYGIDPKKGWVTLLEQRLKENHYNYNVINAGISGDTTSNGLARLPSALKQYHPQITIIELGANDGLRGLQISLIKNNLEKMIELATQAESIVLILGVRLPPNYGITYTQQFQQIYLNLANNKNIFVVPTFLKNVDNNPTLMQPDGIHPNAEAQVIILNNVWEVLKNLLSAKVT